MRGSLELRKFILHRIEEARLLAGFNTVEMARRLHMARPTYAKLESGDTVFIDVTLLIQIAEVTGRKFSFFLPDAEAGDLVTTIKQTYPEMDADSLPELLLFASDLQDRDRRVRRVRSEASDTSNVHTGDTNG
jgi:transcriptional regulator with XRE-family HTH domain